MSRILPAALAAALLLSGCDGQNGGAEPKPHDFALSLTVEAPGTDVRRIALPPAALIALKRPDKGDIRILDAHDRPLSIAFVAPNVAEQGRIRLDAIPFGSPTVAGRAAPLTFGSCRAAGRIG